MNMYENGASQRRGPDYSSMNMRAQQALEQRQQKLQRLAKQLEDKYSKTCSHKPEITHYEFQEKRDNFYKTVDEQVRRKQESLERNEIRKAEEELQNATFQPDISPYSQLLDRGDEPIHERLFRMAKSITERNNENEHRLRHAPHGTLPTPRRSLEDSVEERMYREAEEIRHRKERQQQERELEMKQFNDHKLVTERSELMARSKQERHLRDIFDKVAQTRQNHINYIQLGEAMKLLGLFRTGNSRLERRSENEVRIHESLFEVMDMDQSGWISYENFRRIVLPIFTSLEDVEDDETRRVLRKLKGEIKTLNVNRFVYAKTKNFKNRDAHEEVHSFHPTLNPQSIDLDHGHDMKVVMEDGDNNDGQDKEVKGPSKVKKIRAHRYEKLITQQKKLDERLEQERKKAEEKRMQQCTFAPKTSKYKFKKRKETKKPRYEMLYQKASENKREEPTITLTEKKELAQCTFQPDRTRTKKFDPARKSSIVPATPRGFEQVIERMRRVQREKQNMQESEAALLHAKNWSKGKTEPKPFEFELDRRQRQRAVLYMDINLGPGKMGRIGIHGGDYPQAVAKNFSQSYSLDELLTKRLEELVRENMQKNGIPIGDSGSSRSRRVAPRRRPKSNRKSADENNYDKNSPSNRPVPLQSSSSRSEDKFMSNGIEASGGLTISVNNSEHGNNDDMPSLYDDQDIVLNMDAVTQDDDSNLEDKDEEYALESTRSLLDEDDGSYDSDMNDVGHENGDNDNDDDTDDDIESPSRELIKSLQQLRTFTQRENRSIDHNLLSLELDDN